LNLQKIKSKWISQIRSFLHRLEALSPEWQSFARQNHAAAQLIVELHRRRLTYCSRLKLIRLFESVQHVVQNRIPGIFVEAGCGLGGSAILIAKHKPADTPFFLYDVFAMIPPPGPNDGRDAHRRYEEIHHGASAGIGSDLYYGYEKDLMGKVVSYMHHFEIDVATDRITLIKGTFEETLQLQQPVALAHLDCDWYDSVKICLERIKPWLGAGGRIVFDDYYSYSGCRRAADEFLNENPDFEIVLKKQSLTIQKNPA
jgi:hypothetical protein